jgi:hypothetical protein
MYPGRGKNIIFGEKTDIVFGQKYRPLDSTLYTVRAIDLERCL